MKNSNELGEIKDTIDNLIGALEIPMPPQFHVDRLKAALSELSERVKILYIEEEDDNPWEIDILYNQTNRDGI